MRRTLVTYLAGLRFPRLFVVTAVLFVLDLLIPDAVPFLDELLLAVLAGLLGMVRRGRRDQSDD